MLKITLIALLLAQSDAARPFYDEHLLPEESIFTDRDFRLSAFGGPFSLDFEHYMHYEEHVARVLHDAFRFEIVARVLAYPSFKSEFAIALELKDEKYRILLFEPSVQLRHFDELEIMQEKAETEELASYQKYLDDQNIELPETREQVEISQCEISISNELGAKLYSLWSEMLFRTRYPDLRPASPDAEPALLDLAIDGTSYHFSFEYPGFTLAGRIHSPREDSTTGRFVDITETMKSACLQPDNITILTNIEQRIDALMATLSETDF
ncbi:hypothetical protein PUV54_02835 [Hyphococcus flavus]|uniref:Uncharacterized protein n=1 Tax=Hyphococcus flavus TaxID=1866326 RepID=A0AAF0CF31_9PROT|nr:hypothetical protein [Hyphococcus flavus]WDI32126.1 hypothetical protein PUV54_02835 [Hyphococcus flavus]